MFLKLNKEYMNVLDKARLIRNISASASIFNLITPFLSGDLFVFYLLTSLSALFFSQIRAVRIWRLVHLNHPHYVLYEELLSVPWSLKALAPIEKVGKK